MFGLKSFEKSLRSTPPSYQVPVITPVKTEVHKGCTGKAHACGSIKSTRDVIIKNQPPKVQAKPKGEKNQRKNSLSSETISDSGSEISSLNSNENGELVAPGKLPKPVKKANSMNSPNRLLQVRRRTSDVSVDSPDNVQRPRLLSESEPKDDACKLRRSSSFRVQAKPRPSLPNILGKVKTTIVAPLAATTPSSPSSAIKANNFNTPRIRNSFRAKNHTIPWQQLWEKSFSHKSHGGTFKQLEKLLLDSPKVAKVKVCLY